MEVKVKCALLSLIVMTACEQMVEKPDAPKVVDGSTIVRVFDIDDLTIDDTIAYQNFEVPEITESVIESGYVLAFVCIAGCEAWVPLPEIYMLNTGQQSVVTFLVKEDWVSLQIMSQSLGMLRGTTMAYEGRYRLKVVVGQGVSPLE